MSADHEASDLRDRLALRDITITAYSIRVERLERAAASSARSIAHLRKINAGLRDELRDARVGRDAANGRVRAQTLKARGCSKIIDIAHRALTR